MRNGNKKHGTVLLEVVVAVSIISVSLFSLMSVMNMSFGLMEDTAKNIQASFLLEEGVEVLKIFRDSSWEENIAPLNAGTYYYLDFSDNNWIATSSNIYIDGIFERFFVLSDVYRGDGDDIVSSGGILDADTRKVAVSVSWRAKKATTTRSISTYITNLFDN